MGAVEVGKAVVEVAWLLENSGVKLCALNIAANNL